MNKEYTGNDGKYKRLSAEERGEIEAYRSLNCSISKIAGLINRSKSTVCEEISEGNTMVGTRRALLKTERKRDEESRTNTRNGRTPSF